MPLALRCFLTLWRNSRSDLKEPLKVEGLAGTDREHVAVHMIRGRFVVGGIVAFHPNFDRPVAVGQGWVHAPAEGFIGHGSSGF